MCNLQPWQLQCCAYDLPLFVVTGAAHPSFPLERFPVAKEDVLSVLQVVEGMLYIPMLCAREQPAPGSLLSWSPRPS